MSALHCCTVKASTKINSARNCNLCERLRLQVEAVQRSKMLSFFHDCVIKHVDYIALLCDLRCNYLGWHGSLFTLMVSTSGHLFEHLS